MSDLLESLSQDHRNVAWLLELLERELDAVATAGNPDIELMHDVMRYMNGYPDRVHHPKEDLIFDRLVERDPDAAGIVEHLKQQHVELHEHAVEFLHTLEQVSDCSLVPRDSLAAAGRRFVNLLRDHMREENEIAFPMARDLLRLDDWAYAEQAFANAQDPVFGPVVEQSFKDLLTHIERMQA